MPRQRSLAATLAFLALAHAPAVALAAVAQQYAAHLHSHLHADLGRAAEHGHEHPEPVVHHGHEAITQPRAGETAAPEPTPAALSSDSPASVNPRGGAAEVAQGTGCDPPASVRRNPILRI